MAFSILEIAWEMVVHWEENRMYDGYIYCEEYGELKDCIVDILNGEITDYDIEALSERVQELYDSGKMQATQYDDLMRYLQDM